MDNRRSSPPEAQILVVEDNPGDVRLLEEAFRDGRITNQLHIITNGGDALDFVQRQEEYEDAPRPDMVLLDLNLPQLDGEDLLHEIKHHPNLEDVPVIVLTGVDEDLIESRDLDHDADEDAVIKKPIDPDEFVDVVRDLDIFGLSVVRIDAEWESGVESIGD